VLESNRELVLRRLLECLARDRTKHQVAEVTSLGLVQMTRKRVGSGLLEAFSETCECCNGRGLLISLDGVEHSHRGRQDGAPANKDAKQARDGKQGRDSRRQRQGPPDPGGQGEDKPAASAAPAAEAPPAEPGADAPADAAAATAPPGAAEAVGNGAGADAGPAQAFGGRRRRRAATREPGPPDAAVGTDGQAAPEASAAAGV
jgi:ribonuclease E